MPRMRTIGVTLLACLALGACSTDGAGSPGAAQAVTGSPGDPGATDAPLGRDQAQELLRRVRTAIEQARTYRMTMAVEGGPEAVSLVGTGDVSDPAHPQADATVTVKGGVTSRLVVNDQSAYVQLPGTDRFLAMSPDSLRHTGGQDITALVFPTDNLRATEGAVTDISPRGTETVGSEQLRRYAVTLDPERLADGPVPTAPSGTSDPAAPPSVGGPTTAGVPAPTSPAVAPGGLPTGATQPTTALAPGAATTSAPGLPASPGSPDSSASQGTGTPQPGATPSIPTGPVTYDMWLDQGDRLRKMVMTFSGRTLTLTLDSYGTPVTITTPPPTAITRLPQPSPPPAGTVPTDGGVAPAPGVTPSPGSTAAPMPPAATATPTR